MSYRLEEQLTAIPSVTVDDKLITVDGVTTFDATDEQLENIKKYFVVKEVSEDAEPVETQTETAIVPDPQPANEPEGTSYDALSNPSVAVKRTR